MTTRGPAALACALAALLPVPDARALPDAGVAASLASLRETMGTLESDKEPRK